jgi:RNA polymerase sigma-70 factor, ECF subfamily
MSDVPSANHHRLDEFVRLLSEHERGVLLFILSLVPNWADAEEIRQETNIKLWQEFDKFQLGSDFGKWARTIARYQVLAFNKRQQRSRLDMNRQSIDSLDAKVAAVTEREKTRSAALAECVDELAPHRRELVRLYYTVGQSIKDIARDLKCTSEAIYKTLQRARFDLRRCVDHKLQERERA